MLVDAKFSSWEEAEKAVISGDKRVLIDSENYDRILVFDYFEYCHECTLMDTLDRVLGGWWIELNADSRHLLEMHKHFGTTGK